MNSAAPHRILVVDDEPNIVDVITMALRFQGFQVESAGTGRDALAAVRSFDPHLMVLDIMLPDMEGFEVAERLGARAGRLDLEPLEAQSHRDDVDDVRLVVDDQDTVERGFARHDSSLGTLCCSSLGES